MVLGIGLTPSWDWAERSAPGRLARRASDSLLHELERVADVAIPAVLDQVLSRVDLTDIVIRYVDLDRVVAAVDLDGAARRLDLIGLADYVIDGVDLPLIIRQSSASVTSDAVRGMRMQGIEADQAITRFLDHLRPHRRVPEQTVADGRVEDMS